MLRGCLRLNALMRTTDGFHGANKYMSSVAGNSKVYELRKYDIKPHCMGSFLNLHKEQFKLRLKHSKFVGFWNAELGALNQVIHIWEYDDFAHRTAVRTALAQDLEWNEKFISKAFELFDKQENCILHLPQWCNLNLKDMEKGVYELVTFSMKMGGPVIWEEKLKSSLLAHARLGYADLVGVWYTDIGDHNNVEVLWKFDSMDTRRNGREKAHRDRVVTSAVRDNLQNVCSHRSVIMSPFPPSMT